MIILHLLAFVGSVSLGYSLLRVGFAEKQDAQIYEKIGLSLALGILIFIPGYVASTVYENSFFIISGIFYIIFFICFFTKRIYFNEKDTIPLIKTNKTEFIPTKIKILDEKLQNHPSNITKTKENSNQTETQIFKEQNNKIIKQVDENSIKIKSSSTGEIKKDILGDLSELAHQLKTEKKKDTKKNIKKKKDDDIEELFEITESDF